LPAGVERADSAIKRNELMVQSMKSIYNCKLRMDITNKKNKHLVAESLGIQRRAAKDEGFVSWLLS